MVATVQRNIKNVMRTGATRLFGVDGLGQAAFREASEFAPASALALKAPLISPEFGGEPLAPTAPLGTNTNQIATMAALKAAVDASPGGGGVTGPGSATVGNMAVFNDVGGGSLADSAVAIADVITALTKSGLLTVTAPTDLDDLRTKVAGLDSAVVLIGTFAPAGGVLPGGGAAQRGNCWIATNSGTIGGVTINTGDRVMALVDNASTSVFAGNWFLEDYTDQVMSIDGQTGAVIIEAILNAKASKAAIVDADLFPVLDSEASFALKKWSWANVKSLFRTYLLGTANQWTAPQFGSVTNLSVSGGNIAWDLASNNDFRVVLDAASCQLQFPSNAATRINQKGRILIVQDAVGGRTFTAAAGIKVIGSATLPAVLSAANAESYLGYDVISATTIAISLGGVGG